MGKDEAFPVDWDNWQEAWRLWYHRDAFPRIVSTRRRFPGVNFMADEVIGVYETPAGLVELSRVTFPDLTKCNGDRVRYVGLTFTPGADDPRNGLVSTFGELEKALGLS